jgi:hypothetical protein
MKLRRKCTTYTQQFGAKISLLGSCRTRCPVNANSHSVGWLGREKKHVVSTGANMWPALK